MDIIIGNVRAVVDFRVKAWQAEKFVEVLDRRMEELRKLVDELAKQRELNEILNGRLKAEREEKIKPRTFAEAFAENRIDVIC